MKLLFCFLFLVSASLSVGYQEDEPLETNANPGEDNDFARKTINSDPISQEELETSGNKEVDLSKENSLKTSVSFLEELEQVILKLQKESLTTKLEDIIKSYNNSKAFPGKENFLKFASSVQEYLKIEVFNDIKHGIDLVKKYYNSYNDERMIVRVISIQEDLRILLNYYANTKNIVHQINEAIKDGFSESDLNAIQFHETKLNDLIQNQLTNKILGEMSKKIRGIYRAMRKHANSNRESKEENLETMTDINEASSSKSKRKRKRESLENDNGLDSKVKIKEIIGTAVMFAYSGLDKFKNINDKESLEPFINSLYLYLEYSNIIQLSVDLKDIINRINENESNEVVLKAITQYLNLEEPSLLKLKYAILWIQKRIDLIEITDLKKELHGILLLLQTTKSFFEFISEDVHDIKRYLTRTQRYQYIKVSFNKLVKKVKEKEESDKSKEALGKVKTLGMIEG